MNPEPETDLKSLNPIPGIDTLSCIIKIITSQKNLSKRRDHYSLTNVLFKKSTKNITKIGTVGGWVKASTGYSFKNCEKYSLKIIDNIKKGKALRIIPKKRYYFLDKILLGVLSTYNNRGETIFYRLIKRNYTKKILQFLDEESRPLDILKIVFSMRSIYFILIFFRSLFKKAL